jgi:hypothetical protein
MDYGLIGMRMDRRKVKVTYKDGMVYVAGGTFQMGSNSDSDETPRAHSNGEQFLYGQNGSDTGGIQKSDGGRIHPIQRL